MGWFDRGRARRQACRHDCGLLCGSIIAHINPLDCRVKGKTSFLTLDPVCLQPCEIIILNLGSQSL
jgi:hypothetical protein